MLSIETLDNPLSDVYVDKYTEAVSLGLGVESPVLAATTDNIDDFAHLMQQLPEVFVIDGVLVPPSRKVLVKNQVDSTENGIYSVENNCLKKQTSGYALRKTFLFVEDGTQNKDTSWIFTRDSTGMRMTITPFQSVGDMIPKVSTSTIIDSNVSVTGGFFAKKKSIFTDIEVQNLTVNGSSGINSFACNECEAGGLL